MNPSSPNAVRALQRMLRDLALLDAALPRVVPDGVYDRRTAEAVAAFQRREGLPPTGTADLATWRRACCAWNGCRLGLRAEAMQIPFPREAVFRAGDRSPLIALAQALLSTLDCWSNFAPLAASGELDAPTRQALAQLRRCAGLPENGTLDVTLWNLLLRAGRIALDLHGPASG